MTPPTLFRNQFSKPRFFRDNFDAIAAKVRGASPSLMNACILYCCAGFATRDKAAMLEQFLLVDKADELKLNRRAIEQMLETIRANAEFVEASKKSPAADPATWVALLELQAQQQ